MSPDPLQDYRRKRDFERSPEPEESGVSAGAAPLSFVVQRHDARSLHWDLRLEVDDRLASWAIPKGFSYDPRQKRLALRTEDHPLTYLAFEGVIPEGQYGAGRMTIWDRGTLQWLTGYELRPDSKELKFVLRGRRLRGEWHLVQTRGDGGRGQGDKRPWLLFKGKDRYAGPDRDAAVGHDLMPAPAQAMPKRLRPMTADSVRPPFDHPDWLFELRFPGKEMLVYIDHSTDDPIRSPGGGLGAKAMRALGNVRATQAVLHGVRGNDDVLYVGDVLHFDGFDLRPLPFRERKGILRHLLPPGDAVQLVDAVPAEGVLLAQKLAEQGGGVLRACRADQPYVAGESEHCIRIEVPAVPVEPQTTPRAARPAARRRRTPFTRLDKVLFPDDGYTKGDLIRYYQRVAEVAFPYADGRPLHLHRFPDGIHRPSFYQRHGTAPLPDGMAHVAVTRGGRAPQGEPTEDRFLTLTSADGLASLANLGSIDFHPWLGRLPTGDPPDQAVWDLDPKGAPFAQVVELARHIGALLRRIGLRPAVKTSGKDGIHVYVGLVPQLTTRQVSMFCEGVARLVVTQHPELATLERAVPKRNGRIYVDVQQNSRSQAVVGAYAVRPVRGAQVSTPLRWEELGDPGLHPGRFNILTVPRRIEEMGDLFRPVLDDPQDLRDAINGLSAELEP